MLSAVSSEQRGAQSVSANVAVAFLAFAIQLFSGVHCFRCMNRKRVTNKTENRQGVGALASNTHLCSVKHKYCDVVSKRPVAILQKDKSSQLLWGTHELASCPYPPRNQGHRGARYGCVGLEKAPHAALCRVGRQVLHQDPLLRSGEASQKATKPRREVEKEKGYPKRKGRPKIRIRTFRSPLQKHSPHFD